MGLDARVEVNIYIEAYLASIVSVFDAQIVNEIRIDGKPIEFVVNVPEKEFSSCIARLEGIDFIRYTEPNVQYQASLTPDDPDWTLQYDRRV